MYVLVLAATCKIWASLSNAMLQASSSSGLGLGLDTTCRVCAMWVRSLVLIRPGDRLTQAVNVRLCSKARWSFSRQASRASMWLWEMWESEAFSFSWQHTRGPRTHQPVKPGTGVVYALCMAACRKDSQHIVLSLKTQSLTCWRRASGGKLSTPKGLIETTIIICANDQGWKYFTMPVRT